MLSPTEPGLPRPPNYNDPSAWRPPVPSKPSAYDTPGPRPSGQTPFSQPYDHPRERVNNPSRSQHGSRDPLDLPPRSNQGSLPRSLHGSNDHLYDPVGFDDRASCSTYEPIDINKKDPYGQTQPPTDEFLPRVGIPGRNRLGPPPPTPQRTYFQPQESDIDSISIAPSIQSDVDYLPRNLPRGFEASRHPPPAARDRGNNSPLPPKPGASDGSDSQHGSRDQVDRMPRPPPYSTAPRRFDVSSPPSFHSNSTSEEPPPYSPGDMPANVMYLGGRGDAGRGGGGRPTHTGSVETEI